MKGMQRRMTTLPPMIEYRDEGGVKLPIIRGYASVFNELTTLYNRGRLKIEERINPGAFREALNENQDVVLNFNHDNNFTLARTGSNTLRLSEDEKGLAVDAEILDSQRNRDWVIDPAKRKDLPGMSFAFYPRQDGWKETREETDSLIIYRYEITAVDLFDVSVVTNPAYKGAGFDIRSYRDFDSLAEEAEKTIETERQRKLFLMSSALDLFDF